MEKRQRAHWVDAARGVGILLIVFAHSIRPDMREANALCKWLYDMVAAVDIGMLLVLSGTTYRMARHTAEPKQFLLRKLRSLLAPFFGYALLIYAIFSFFAWLPLTAGIFQGTEYGRMPLREYLWLTMFSDSPYAAHLWFIWLLFWVTCIVYACDRLCRNHKDLQRRALWALAAALWVWGTFGGIESNVLRGILTHTSYFVFGTEIALHPPQSRRGGKAAAAAVVLSAGFVMWYLSLDAGAVSWSGAAWWQVCWLLIRFTLIWGLIRLTARLDRVRWLTYIGRNSFWIYLLHQPFCCGFVGLLLYSKLALPIPLVCAVCIALALALPLAAQRVIQRAAAHRKGSEGL